MRPLIVWANPSTRKGTLGTFYIDSLAARWWEGLGNVAWAQARRKKCSSV